MKMTFRYNFPLQCKSNTQHAQRALGLHRHVLGTQTESSFLYILRAPTHSTMLSNLGLEGRVADLATRSTEPTGRCFDLLELITRQFDLL